MRRYIIIIFLLCSTLSSYAQAKNYMPPIPGFDPALPATLNNGGTLLGVVGLAALSYTLEEFVFKNHENVNFYTSRAGFSNEYGWGLRSVALQNFGLEHRVASWFSMSAELNLQEAFDATPNIASKDKFGMGLGVMTYFRWYLFGKKRVSPYLEYGTGVFVGFSKFPYNGSNVTINHSTQIGVEYTINEKSKARVSYGSMHQSNYGFGYSDPGYDANGFMLSYAWRIFTKNKK